MFVVDAVRRFDQLARLCPHVAPTEEDRVRKILDMLHPEISMVVESGGFQPTTVAKCVERAVNAEFHIKKIKEERKKFFETKKNERNQNKGSRQGNNQQNQNNNKRKGNFNGQRSQSNGQQSKNFKTNSQYSNYGKHHFGECRLDTNKLFTCGGNGHNARG